VSIAKRHVKLSHLLLHLDRDQKDNFGLCNHGEKKNRTACVINRWHVTQTALKKGEHHSRRWLAFWFAFGCDMDRNFPGIFHYAVNVIPCPAKYYRCAVSCCIEIFSMPITGNRSRWNALNKRGKYARPILTSKLKFMLRASMQICRSFKTISILFRSIFMIKSLKKNMSIYKCKN